MERINKIYNLEEYKEELRLIAEDEKDRIYCKHNIEHFLDVARIAYIINLEENIGYNKAVIYATSLLHDIGRHREYEYGIEHHKASKDIANEMLKKTNFNNDEIKIICEAIEEHRNQSKNNRLNEIIYKADKISRKCYACSAVETCKWDENKKNKSIGY